MRTPLCGPLSLVRCYTDVRQFVRTAGHEAGQLKASVGDAGEPAKRTCVSFLNKDLVEPRCCARGGLCEQIAQDYADRGLVLGADLCQAPTGLHLVGRDLTRVERSADAQTLALGAQEGDNISVRGHVLERQHEVAAVPGVDNSDAVGKHEGRLAQAGPFHISQLLPKSMWTVWPHLTVKDLAQIRSMPESLACPLRSIEYCIRRYGWPVLTNSTLPTD